MKSIPDISKRFFKVRFGKGWKTLYFNSTKKLWRFIRINKPLDCYISLNSFINVKDVDKSEKPIISRYRTCVDIDDTSRQNALSIVSKLRENNMRYDYILQTSKNSLQIVLNGSYDKQIKKLLKGADYCSSTLNSPKTVIRLPFSKHHSGFITKYLSESLEGFKGISKKKIKEVKKQHEFFFRFLRQRVSGIKKNDRYVLFQKGKFLNLNKIRYLQKKFNLGDCYILEYPKEKESYGFLYCKAIQYSQLRKIQKSQNFIRISKKRNGELILAPSPKLFKIIKSKTKGYFSYPHMEFIRSLGVKTKYPIEIGKKDTGQIGKFKG